MKVIPLTQGKVALISNQDSWLVRQFKWCAMWNGYNWYAVANMGRQKCYMHRLLAGFPPFLLDHKNGNGLDNRRTNLRPASTSENGANHKRQKLNTSGCSGVYKNKRDSKWYARIKVMYRYVWLGSFDKFRDAVKARQKAEKTYFGEFLRA
jgi:hypothetical protein